MQIKKRELKLDVFGNIYMVNFPSAKRMNDYMENISKCITGDIDKTDYQLTSELFLECGLPQEVIDELYVEDMKDILQVLDGRKKI
jgi:hypothetical protein